MAKKLFRLYVDETGTHGFKKKPIEAHDRYLGLTGICITKDLMLQVKPKIDKIKNDQFGTTRVTLRRTDIRRKTGDFAILEDNSRRQLFDQDLLSVLCTTDYVIFSIVVDKENYKTKFGENYTRHPYHDCIYELMHVYALFLHEESATGDIMAEARGAKEDRLIQAAYQDAYENGHQVIDPEFFQSVLISKEIKLKTKKHNIHGLQMADCLAHPCTQGILHDKGKLVIAEGCYSFSVLDGVKDKYYAERTSGEVWGFGRILLE